MASDNRAGAAGTACLALSLLLTQSVFGQAVYVTNSSTHNVSAYLVKPGSGELSVVGPPVITGVAPVQALIHPSGKFLYVLNAGPNDISAYAISSPSGALTPIACPLCSAVSPSGMAMHPSGQALFVTNLVQGTITPYSINVATASLTKGPPANIGADSRPVQPAIDPSGRFLYVANSGTGKVSGFAVDSGGSLTSVPGSPFAAGSGPAGIAVSATMVFVVNQFSGDLSVYRIGPAGSLTPAGSVPTGGNPTSVAVDPTGMYIYVANQTQIVAFAAQPNGGFPLTQIRAYNAGATPYAVAVAPEGNFVYVANLHSNDVSAFAISAGGTLIPLGSASTFGALGPKSLTVGRIGDTTAISLTTPLPTGSPYGTPLTIKGIIRDTLNPATIPQGSVTLTINGNLVHGGTVPLDSAGGFEFVIGAQLVPIGSNTFEITYNPSPGFQASAPLRITYTVNFSSDCSGTPTKVTPSFTISFSPGNPVAPQPMDIYVSAPLTGGKYPTGTVVFSIDNIAVSAVPLANGSAMISYPAASGDHGISVVYSGDGCFASTAAGPVSFHANRTTATAVSSLANSLVYGQTATLVATVSAGGGVVGGTVDFYDGATKIGAANISQGGGIYLAQLSSYKVTSLGPHFITAVYTGDANNLASNNNGSPLVLPVTAASVSVPTPAVTGTQTYSQPLTFTAAVTAAAPGSGTPTGTVSFKEGATTLGTAIVTGGAASFTISSLHVGPHIITATYGGDANFLAGSSIGGLQVTIAQVTPTVTVSATPVSPVLYGQAVTLVATLTGTPSATGAVDFIINGTKAGSGVVSGSGNVATFSFTPAAAGSYAITATYNGDSNNSSNSGSTTLTVNQVSVNVSAPSVSGTLSVAQPVTLAVTVSAASPGSGTPTGSISFKEGTTTLGTQILAAGSATFTTSLLTPGTHSIVATYAGDTNFAAGVSTAAPVLIAKLTPAVSVSASPGSPVAGQAITVLATLDGAPGMAFTGTMDFFDAGTKINPAPLTVSEGKAQFGPYAIGGAGPHVITAVYSGDANHNTANNNGSKLSITVKPAPVTVSTPVVSGNAAFGQQLTIAVTVAAGAPGSGTPTGTVSFRDGAITLGTVPLAGGLASMITSTLHAGPHTITAAYGGETNFLPGDSTGAGQVTIAQSTPVTTVVATPASSIVYGQQVTLAATLAGTPAATGNVEFSINGTKIGSGVPGGSGNTATFSFVPPAPASYTVTASYNGDHNNLPSSSSTTLTVKQASVAVSTRMVSGTPTAGQSVTFNVAVSAVAPGTGVPTGVVTFKDGDTTIGGATLTAGSGSLTTSALAIGPHAISAIYTGDGNFLGAASSPLTFVADKAASTTILSVSQTSTSTGLTALVGSSLAMIPTGTVEFYSGTSLLGSAGLITTGGFATANIHTGAISGTITAVYSGNGNFNGSTSAPANITLAPKLATSLTLKAGPLPVTSGQPTTLTVNFSWSGSTPAGTTPGGTIQILDGSTLLGTVPAKALASLTVNLASGNHNLVAAYTGDGTFPSATANYALVVNKNNGLTLSLSPDKTAAIFGEVITLTATIGLPSGGLAAPTGLVEFMERGAVLGNAPLVNGRAVLRLSNLAPGTHPTAARYAGDMNWIPATSSTASVTVAKMSTEVKISASNALAGQMRVTATVEAALPIAVVPAGTVQFVDALTGQVLGTASLTGDTATATVPAGPASFTIAAVYLGDVRFGPSSSAPVAQFSILNAASYASTVLAPDAIATVFSPALTSETITAEAPLPEVLGKVTVTLVDSAGATRRAPLFYVSATQLSFLVPRDIALGPATLRVTTARGGVITVAVMIGSISPALFSANARGEGAAAAQIIRVHPDGTQDAPQNTAIYDSTTNSWIAAPIGLSAPEDKLYLVLYATGVRHRASAVTVMINGEALPALYAGAQPTYAGLDQINVLLPASLAGTGTVNVTVTVDGRPSNTVTLRFQ